jgi:hypothetical protein
MEKKAKESYKIFTKPDPLDQPVSRPAPTNLLLEKRLLRTTT